MRKWGMDMRKVRRPPLGLVWLNELVAFSMSAGWLALSEESEETREFG